MRIMGADSVDYHRATVLARGDDHPGQALAYYASGGEPPLLGGGAGARLLGLQGAVTDEQYSALYGPGGACDPTTGERLVNTKRPGLELVISAHKSLANLVRMNDDQGGWKAAVTALWTEHLHAATMVGRMASARVAVELGYGIVH